MDFICKKPENNLKFQPQKIKSFQNCLKQHLCLLVFDDFFFQKSIAIDIIFDV
jgi:hypothetical protein